MKILFIGDIVGAPGRNAVKTLLSQITQEENIDVSIANVENAAGGSGVTPAIVEDLLNTGLACLTSGDHIWKRKEVYKIIDKEPRLLRPANYPEITPGFGSYLLQTKTGTRLGVINLLGRVFMEGLACPFRRGMEEIELIRKETACIIVDIHAEATSEKEAMGWYLDGLVSAVVGTHTHVPTADEKILPKGTAYITDVGMVGPKYSILGRKPEQIIQRFLTCMPTRFEMAEGEIELQAIIIEVDEKTGRANSIRRITRSIK